MLTRSKFISVTFIAVIIVLTAVFFVFVNTDRYHKDETAIAAAVSDNIDNVTETDGKLIFSPQNPEYGLIFYPGGKVEYSSYSPLMHRLAAQNVLCIVTSMPFDLAVFNQNAADGIQENYPSVKYWYIGGHSLGGVMAASYASNHTDTFDGLILLASYSSVDISRSGLNVISVYGSNDGVLDMNKYNESLSLLPADTKELVINGGCHAYFGSYGTQKGDGEPTITSAEQVQQTTEFILKNIIY